MNGPNVAEAQSMLGRGSVPGYASDPMSPLPWPGPAAAEAKDEYVSLQSKHQLGEDAVLDCRGLVLCWQLLKAVRALPREEGRHYIHWLSDYDRLGTVLSDLHTWGHSILTASLYARTLKPLFFFFMVIMRLRGNWLAYPARHSAGSHSFCNLTPNWTDLQSLFK